MGVHADRDIGLIAIHPYGQPVALRPSKGRGKTCMGVY